MPVSLRRYVALVAALAVMVIGRAGAIGQSTSDRISSVSVVINIVPQNAQTDQQRYTVNLTDCRDLTDANESIVITWTFARAPEDAALYTIKIQTGDETCAEESLSREPSDECVTWVERQALTSTTLRARIPWEDVTGLTDSATCDGLSSYWNTVILIFTATSTSDGTDGTNTDFDETEFDFATQRPTVPTGLEVTPGEAAIRVSWNSVSDAASYDVFYSTNELTAGSPPEDVVASMVNTTNTSATLTSGIQVNRTYYIAVSTVDSWYNGSLLSAVEEAETQPVTDFYELYRDMGGKDPGCAVGEAQSVGAAGSSVVLLLMGLLLIRQRRARRRDAR